MKPFVYQHRVRYSEIDQLKIAYYAHYLAWFEAARVELLRHLGFTYAALEREGFFLPVVSCEIKYVAPARYDDLLNIVTSIDRIGQTSVTFRYEVKDHAKQKLLAEAKTALVCVNEHFKPTRLPPKIRELLVDRP